VRQEKKSQTEKEKKKRPKDISTGEEKCKQGKS
jgi:hypothetical protein